MTSYSFIGMSAAGKSFWSHQLADELGMVRIDIDQIIADHLGLANVNAVGDWLGMPNSDGYTTRSNEYLQLESHITHTAMQRSKSEPVIIDTTGSVVHLADDILQQLADNTHVIYLTTPTEVIQEMIDLYLTEPKPVTFGEFFTVESDEDFSAAFTRNYRNLLKWRQQRYQSVSDQSFDGRKIPTVHDLIQQINVDSLA